MKKTPREQRPFLARAGTFDEAFPSLEDAILKYQVLDYDGLGPALVHSLRGDGPKLTCKNPKCHEGGYGVEHEVRLMILICATSKEIEMHCPGWETKPKHSIGDACTRSIRGVLELKTR
jgi:hypothetical protein